MFCERKNIPVTHFENFCGMSNGYVNGIRKSISKEKLEQILKAYPEIRREWLVFEDGFMLTTDTPEIVERERQRGLRDRLIVFISSYLQLTFVDFEQKCCLPPEFIIMQKPITNDIIDNICNMYPNLNRRWLEWGLGDMLIDEYVTIYERLKQQFKLHKLDFGKWETKTLGWSAGTLSRSKTNLSEAKVDYIAEKLPPEVDKDWILQGRRKFVRTTAAEPSMPYVVSVYEDTKATQDNIKIEQPEVHEISEGTKGVIIPLNLSRNPKKKLEDIGMPNMDIGRIVQDFTFMYQVQTQQLESFFIQAGDWLLLAKLKIEEIVNNEVYFVNSQKYGCMVRVFQWKDEKHCNLVNIDDSSDVLTTEIDDINDILAIVSIMKNCTSLLPFSHTSLGKMMIEKDKMIQDAMQYNKQMFDELRKYRERTDMLIDVLIKNQKQITTS